MNESFKTYACVTLSMIFWSFSFVWSKIALQTYQPITIIFIRLILSSAMLVIVLTSVKQLQKLQREDIKHFLLLVLFQPLLYFLGESFGLQRVSPTTASVIISTIPLFSPIAAFYFLKEKITVMNLLGIILSMAGIYFVISVSGLSISASPVGIGLLFIAVFSAVFYSIVLKKISSKYNAVSIITYQNIFGIAYFLPLFLAFDAKGFVQADHNLKAISSIIFLAIFASSLAYIFYTYSVKKLGVVKSIIFVNIIPIFTVIFSFFVIGEEITLQKTAGIIIVIAGVMISQLKSFRFLK
ncbi:MAG: DMT family transporter [Bacteroidia bacterium]|nr:DMT family transporter [Bacteroidia bacterium]